MKFLRKPAFFLAVATALTAGAAAPLRAQNLWIVASPQPVDARLSSQIEALARPRHAKVSFLHTAATDLRNRRGTLIISLEQVSPPAAFQAELAKLTAKSDAPLSPATAEEGYILNVSAAYPSGAERIQIRATTDAGFHYALLRLPEILARFRTRRKTELAPPAQFQAVTRSGRNASLVMADFPSFAQRGIVEGFYGKPWSHRDRLDMLRFEGDHRMNVYYYAPKDDPYHRKLWDEPYPPEEMRQLGELVSAAHDNFVGFCFAVSPGLSMTYSSDSDFQALTAKLDSVAKLGVSCFALFLDDVPQQLENPADVAQFTSLAAAHVFVINRLYQYLKSQSASNRLVVTPTVYTNAWGSRDYIRELGAGVNPDVPIVWTGPQVVSPEITAAQANDWGALLRRKPLIWDNFPVNDGIPWRLILAPLRGRGPDLPTAVQGLFSNPMIQAQASKIPLETVAEYLWNAKKYDPDAALRRALTEQYGPYAPRRLKTFLETYGDYWWDENIFEPLFSERRSIFRTTPMRRRIALLDRSVAALGRNRRYRVLARELAPFPHDTRRRLPEVLADPAFKHLRGGKLRWRADYDVLRARKFEAPPKLDGDFSKWQNCPVYSLDSRDQIAAGLELWRSADQFSTRFALGWDENHLYLGVDVIDPDLYQLFQGRNIAKGDFVSIMLETAFRKNFLAHHAGVDEYDLLFSAGNFQGVAPDVYSSQDYLPPRPIPRDYEKEIQTAWRKTANGYSGDIALPASWFEGGKFAQGYEVGLVFSAQKAFPPPPGTPPDEQTNVKRILFRSKKDKVFPARFGNPQSYQRLVLEGAAGAN
jgi:hypothetical protein